MKKGKKKFLYVLVILPVLFAILAIGFVVLKSSDPHGDKYPWLNPGGGQEAMEPAPEPDEPDNPDSPSGDAGFDPMGGSGGAAPDPDKVAGGFGVPGRLILKFEKMPISINEKGVKIFPKDKYEKHEGIKVEENSRNVTIERTPGKHTFSFHYVGHPETPYDFTLKPGEKKVYLMKPGKAPKLLENSDPKENKTSVLEPGLDVDVYMNPTGGTHAESKNVKPDEEEHPDPNGSSNAPMDDQYMDPSGGTSAPDVSSPD